MKKAYSKPGIYAESFELVEHIASICAGAVGAAITTRDFESCAFIPEGYAEEDAVFTGDTAACKDKYTGSVDNYFIECYEIYNPGSHPFGSS